MNAGVIQQVDGPLQLYEAPANRFVAGFIGSPSMNFLPGRIEGEDFIGEGFTLHMGPGLPAGSAELGLRPEDLLSKGGEQQLPEVELEVVEQMGHESLVYFTLAGTQAVARLEPDLELRPGKRICLGVKQRALPSFCGRRKRSAIDSDRVIRREPEPNSAPVAFQYEQQRDTKARRKHFGRVPEESMKHLIRLLLLALLIAMPAWAGITGKITGTVTDDKGEPLAGVNVVIEGQPRGGATDLDGYYQILNLPPGVYTLMASSMGYASARAEQVAVSVDLTTHQDLVLKVSAIEGETVTIIAQREIVQMDQTFSASYVDASELKALPVTELSEVVDRQAGVVDGHFRGGRKGEVLYMVDGIPVTDVYDNSSGVDVQVSMVQELQVITGTFNAEYGQAMSGVVNTVTRDGNDKLEGSVNFYAGDYVSNSTDKFWNVDELEAFNIGNAEFNLSGPIFGIPKLSFNMTGRYYKNDGWLDGLDLFDPLQNSFYGDNNGRVFRVFMDEYQGFNGWVTQTGDTLVFPVDHYLDSLFWAQDVQNWSADSLDTWMTWANEYSRELYLMAEGDDGDSAEYVHMNTEVKRSAQLKLTYAFSPTSKLRLNYMINDRDYQEYSSSWRFTPDGRLQRYSLQQTSSLKWDFVPSSATFMDLSVSHSLSRYHHWRYEDIMDSRYMDTSEWPTNAYYYYDFGGANAWQDEYTSNTIYVGTASIGGTENANFQRRTDSWIGRGNVSHQLGRYHEMKTGFEVKTHRIFFWDRNVSFRDGEIVEPLGANYNRYTRYPYEGAAYVQDKMEFDQITLNIGLRLDFFDANWKLPKDLTELRYLDDPNTEWEDVSMKWAPQPARGSGVSHFRCGYDSLQLRSLLPATLL